MLGGGIRRLRSGDFPLVLNPLGERRDIRGGGGVERRLGDLDRIILTIIPVTQTAHIGNKYFF